MFFRAFILTLALGFSSNVFFYHSAWALDALPDNNSSFTHTLELKPIPNSYQLAKATFLPDRYDDLGLSDYDSIKSIQPDRNCESYTLSSCPSGALCERCPFDVRKFRAYACTAPYLMSNGDCICPAETPLIYPNDKCTLYCGSRCIQKTCTPSANKTNCTNSTQNCDNGCGQNTRKCCVPCTHKLTSKPANSSYTYCSCTDDSGTKQIQCGCTCNAGYHLKNGTCGSGGICEKDCIANTCSGYTLATCPAHANCTSCSKQTTGCTGGGTVFKMTGCQSGYHQSGNSCVAHSYSCPSGYQASSCSSSQVQTGTTSKKCSCGATSGTCYACRAKTCAEQGKKDCNGSCIATSQCCGGCSSGYTCSNGTCVRSCAVANCATCVSGYSNRCQTCNSGYSVVNYLCQPSQSTLIISVGNSNLHCLAEIYSGTSYNDVMVAYGATYSAPVSSQENLRIKFHNCTIQSFSVNGVFQGSCTISNGCEFTSITSSTLTVHLM